MSWKKIDMPNTTTRPGEQPPEPPLQPPGGGGTFDGMEPRVAKLEAAVEHIQRDIGEIKSDLRALRDEFKSDLRALRDEFKSDLRALRDEIKSDVRALRDNARSDFYILFGAVIAVALGLAGMMARGFHWL